MKTDSSILTDPLQSVLDMRHARTVSLQRKGKAFFQHPIVRLGWRSMATTCNRFGSGGRNLEKAASGQGTFAWDPECARPALSCLCMVISKMVGLIFLLLGCQDLLRASNVLSRFEESQPHMGTTARIVVYAASGQAATPAMHAAFERIRELDSLLSDYQPESELNRLNRQSGGPPVKVGPDLFQVLAASQSLAARTNGAFDVTVGPVIRLWRRARRQRALPETDRLAAAFNLTGFRWLRLDAKQQTAQLAKPGMLLDLGGIAKGYAASEALVSLKRSGIQQALVALGGDIAVSNAPPGKKGWTIEIAPLQIPGAPKPSALLLHNAAVSTSGDAEQFVEIGGIRYSHIINPATGKALTGRRSVTVVAANGTDSDALATAVSVMAPQEGLKLIDATRDAATLIVIQTDQGIRTWKSKRWRH